MSAPVRGRRPSRFTFNIPSPTHTQPPQQQLHTKYPQHPPPPASFHYLKHSNSTIAHRRKVSTPHPFLTHKPAFIDYSLSLHFSPSFSPSSCVISGVPLPDTPTSPTDSPMSELRQQRWSVEMRRQCGDDDEDADDEEEAEDVDEQNTILSPNMLSSSSCSFFSPATTSSSLDSPTSPSPASPASPPLHRIKSSTAPITYSFPTTPLLQPHRRVYSDPLPLPATSTVSSLLFKLHLRPLDIPHNKGGDSIVMLTHSSAVPVSTLTEQQYEYECDEEVGSVDSAGMCGGVDELMYGRPMTLAEYWYGRSELMSPVNGGSMMYMAAQQNQCQPMPFNCLYYNKPTAAS